MSYQRGDVVLVNYPFASGTGSKVRPAFVVQCDRNNARLNNTIVAQITSRTHLARSEPTQILIQAKSDTGQQAGLLIDSAVSCENLYTIEQSLIRKKLGQFPDSMMRQVDECLKESLGIA